MSTWAAKPPAALRVCCVSKEGSTQRRMATSCNSSSTSGRLLARLKCDLPHLRVMVGGPKVARRHPLLYANGSPVDIAVTGEGEPVFAEALGALRQDGDVSFAGVGQRRGRVWRWGRRPRPLLPLDQLLPPPDAPCNRPDRHGMAYLETNRGCPLRCAFCCYNLRRQGGSSLPPADVEARIRILRERGAREIRLVDPTFNAHPRFDAVVAAMTRANPGRALRFFVELRAETLTESQARRLAAAGVAEAEVGVQSTDPRVLRVIHRPASLPKIERGLNLLRRHGIRPTVDFMYGLPCQDKDDLQRSLAWLERLPDAHPQFLPALLLPGTELRDRAAGLKLKAQTLPPYRVLATDTLTPAQLADAEHEAACRLGAFDSPTRRFVGRRLPDLFRDRTAADLTSPRWRPPPGGNRRALIIAGDNLFARRDAVADLIRRTIRHEPHMLWQFVLEPDGEEPLDLIDHLIDTLRRLPGHWLDRLVSPPGKPRLAARRLMIRLPCHAVFSMAWRDAAETLLETTFH